MKLNLDKSWQEFVNSAEMRKDGIILFGASSGADTFLNKLNNKFKIKYIIDNDEMKWGKKFNGYIVNSVEKLQDTTSEDIIIIVSIYWDEMIEQLEELNFKGEVYSVLHLQKRFDKFNDVKILEEKLIELKNICADEKSKEILDKIVYKRKNRIKDYSDIYENNQYFYKEIIEPDENEVFIDGGAYDTWTVCNAIKFEDNKFKRIYAFEPVKEFFDKIDKTKFDDRVKFYNYGLWDRNETLHLVENSTGSYVFEGGNVQIECIALDEFIDEKVTFIKMDIEGSEQEALKGAKNIILRDRPKLAICLYHKPEDLWKIPLWVKELVPEYKIYIRHHNTNKEETVMYAHI